MVIFTKAKSKEENYVSHVTLANDDGKQDKYHIYDVDKKMNEKL